MLFLNKIEFDDSQYMFLSDVLRGLNVSEALFALAQIIQYSLGYHVFVFMFEHIFNIF